MAPAALATQEAENHCCRKEVGKANPDPRTAILCRPRSDERGDRKWHQEDHEQAVCNGAAIGREESKGNSAQQGQQPGLCSEPPSNGASLHATEPVDL